jgi:seryl-tRNA synthetase
MDIHNLTKEEITEIIRDKETELAVSKNQAQTLAQTLGVEMNLEAVQTALEETKASKAVSEKKLEAVVAKLEKLSLENVEEDVKAVSETVETSNSASKDDSNGFD